MTAGQRLTGPKYGKHRTSQRSWRATRVWARRNMDPICGICERAIDLSITNYRDPMAWTLDHIVPVAVGGTNAVSNLQPAHRSCNGAKGDGTKPGNQQAGDQWQSSPTPDRSPWGRRNNKGIHVPEAERAGPDAKDRRTRVYQQPPTHSVILGPDGEQHLRDWGDNTATHWTPGQPWPPRLKPDQFTVALTG